MDAKLPDDPLRFTNLGEVITSLLGYVYTFAGIAMLLMIIAGGFELMTAAGDQAKSKGGYGKIKAGVVGFLIVFVSYFVAQLIEKVLGVTIL